MSNLPNYKSNEYNLKFDYTEIDSNWINKFKQDGELTLETKLIISKCHNYHAHKKLLASWHRPTAQGKEQIVLLEIYPTDSFLDFLNTFTKRTGFLSKSWITSYQTIYAAVQLCKSDQERFKKLVREVKNINELIIAAGFRE